MISPGSQLWEAVRRRSNSSTVDDAVDPKVISYRSLFERAQAKRRKQAGGGLNEPVVLCENSVLERAAAILAAAADELPFFIVETGAISEEEGKALLPLPKTSGDAGTTPDPNTVTPLQTNALDPPFFFMLEPCQSPPLCVRAVGRQTVGEGMKSRIDRLSITDESCVLSLLDPISPGYPHVVCSSLLAGAQWIDAGDEQNAALEALLGGGVTHVEGPPDRVEELLSLCAESDLTSLRYVVLQGPAPDAQFLLFAQEALQAAQCLRSMVSSRGERMKELSLLDAPPSDESIWLHGCEVSPIAYAAWIKGCPGVRDARVIQSEKDYLECFVALDGGWNPETVGSRLQCLPSFARPRAFYSVTGVAPPLSLESPGTLRERSALLVSPGQTGVDDPVLQDVMRIWSDVLKMEISPDDSFTRLGGTSYQMTQVFMRIKEAFPVEIHFVDLYKNVRASALANFIKTQMERQGTLHNYLEKGSKAK